MNRLLIALNLFFVLILVYQWQDYDASLVYGGVTPNAEEDSVGTDEGTILRSIQRR